MVDLIDDSGFRVHRLDVVVCESRLGIPGVGADRVESEHLADLLGLCLRPVAHLLGVWGLW